MIIETKYNLFDKLRDLVTGYEGIVLGITQYDTGCIHYGLCADSLNDKGEIKDWHWFDTSRLERIKPAAHKAKSAKRTGGPSPNAPQS